MAEFDKYRLGSELESHLEGYLSSYEEFLLVDEIWDKFSEIVGYDFVQTAEPGYSEAVKVELGEIPGFTSQASVVARCVSEQIETRQGVEETIRCVCRIRHDVPGDTMLLSEAGKMLRMWERTEFHIDASAMNPFLYSVTPILRTYKKQKFVVPKSQRENDFLAEAGYWSRDCLKRGDQIFLQRLMGIIEEKYTDAIDLG